MSDLIDRQAVLDAVNNCGICIQKIVDLPQIDSVPVRHGKWNCSDDMFEYAICSACKWDSGEAWEYAKKNFIYCPNCGAKMDGERKEE